MIEGRIKHGLDISWIITNDGNDGMLYCDYIMIWSVMDHSVDQMFFFSVDPTHLSNK